MNRAILSLMALSFFPEYEWDKLFLSGRDTKQKKTVRNNNLLRMIWPFLFLVLQQQNIRPDQQEGTGTSSETSTADQCGIS